MGKIYLNGVDYSAANTGSNVTGVKGDAETSYRTGDVNLTPENIGALSLAGGTMDKDANILIDASNGISAQIALRSDDGCYGTIYPGECCFRNFKEDGVYLSDKYLQNGTSNSVTFNGNVDFNKSVDIHNWLTTDYLTIDNLGTINSKLETDDGYISINNNPSNICLTEDAYLINEGGNNQYVKILNRQIIAGDHDNDDKTIIDFGGVQTTDGDKTMSMYYDEIFFDGSDDAWLVFRNRYRFNTINRNFAIAFVVDSDEQYFCPYQSGFIGLGNSAQKWKDIYATNSQIQTSDKNEKKDICALPDSLTKDFIMGLHPVSYKFINNDSDRTHYGMIAQDVEDLMNNLGMTSKDFAGFIKSPKKVVREETVTDENGRDRTRHIAETLEDEYDYGLRYNEFISPLIKMVQLQQSELEALKDRITRLESH